MLRTWRPGRTLVALVFFVALSLLLTYPFPLHLADHLRDNGDSYEYAWDIGFGAYQLTHHPLHLFDGNIFYPFPLSLAYSDSTVPNIVLGTPIVLLTGNPVLALNLLILLTFILGGFGMYLFVLDRTGSPGAAVVAGVVYGFSPYRFDHLAQIPNVSMEWAPFALWCFERYLANGRYRWAAGFVGFVVLQTLVSFYYAFILGIGVALYVAFRLVPTRRAWLRPGWVLPLVGFGVLGALIAAPLVLPYFTVEREFGLKRSLDEATFFSAWPANFLGPSGSLRVALIQPLLDLLHAWRPQLWISDSERRLYPGVLGVVLADVAVARGRPGRWAAPVAMALVGVVLCFGPVFHPTRGVVVSLPFPMPYAVLYAYLPGFAALRVPSRFGGLVVLGLAILAGDGLAILQRSPALRRTRLPGPAAVAALGALIACLEGASALPVTPVPTGAAVPPVYRWLATQPIPSPVVELPIDDDAFRESPRSYLSTYDHQPRVDGFRSFIPPGYAELARQLNAFPSPAAVATLQRLDVRFVVVHRAELTQPLAVPASTPGVRSAARFGPDEVYQISGQSDPADVALDVSGATCLSQTGAPETLTIELRSADRRPVLVLTHGSGDLAFNLDWRASSGDEFRETVRAAVPAEVVVPPLTLAVPYHAPPRPGVYALNVSPADSTGLRGATTLPAIPVGNVSVPPGLDNGRPRLLQGDLRAASTTAKDGLPYHLTWQLPASSFQPVEVFVDAYDAANRYWSYGSETEERFQRPADCSGNLVQDATTLILNPATPPGHYWVEAGLLDPTTRKRVVFTGPTGESVDHVQLGSFWVRPPNVYAAGALPPPDAGPTYDFGHEIALEGWTLDGGERTSGDRASGALRLTLRWRAERAMATTYTVFIHLTDLATGKVVAQYDGQPTGGVYPTSAWAPGDTLLEQYAVPIPSSLPPGAYRLGVGLYDGKTLERLPIFEPPGEPSPDEAVLTTVTR